MNSPLRITGLAKTRVIMASALMPPLKHWPDKNKPFDINDSEVCAWLHNEQSIKDWAFSVCAAMGSILFDKATGCWVGADTDVGKILRGKMVEDGVEKMGPPDESDEQVKEVIKADRHRHHRTGRVRNVENDKIVELLPDSRGMSARAWQKLAEAELKVSRATFFRRMSELIEDGKVVDRDGRYFRFGNEPKVVPAIQESPKPKQPPMKSATPSPKPIAKVELPEAPPRPPRIDPYKIMLRELPQLGPMPEEDDWKRAVGALHLSDHHFTLALAWLSMKSFIRKGLGCWKIDRPDYSTHISETEGAPKILTVHGWFPAQPEGLEESVAVAQTAEAQP